MTDENAKKKYAHLQGLIAGKMKTGNPVRDDLIVSDAKKHLADLLKKRPYIDFDGSKAKKDIPSEQDKKEKSIPEKQETKTKSKEKE